MAISITQPVILALTSQALGTSERGFPLCWIEVRITPFPPLPRQHFQTVTPLFHLIAHRIEKTKWNSLPSTLFPVQLSSNKHFPRDQKIKYLFLVTEQINNTSDTHCYAINHHLHNKQFIYMLYIYYIFLTIIDSWFLMEKSLFLAHFFHCVVTNTFLFAYCFVLYWANHSESQRHPICYLFHWHWSYRSCMAPEPQRWTWKASGAVGRISPAQTQRTKQYQCTECCGNASTSATAGWKLA